MPRSPLTAGLVSRPVQRAPLARAEREPGPRARSAKRRGPRSIVSPLGPGSRYARPGHEGSAAREANRWLRSLLTMSNSAVFFVPAARLCARVCPSVRLGLGRSFGVEPAVALAAIPAPAIPFHPDRGVDGAPTGHSFCFVARARRDLRALRRGLSRSERDLSRRSTMAIFGRGPTPPPPGVKDRSRQRLVRKPQGLAEGSLASRGSGSRRSRGRHSSLRLQDRLRRRPS